MRTRPKVIAIVGPTSSGKTALSIAIAKKYHGEIISADSRQVYKGMDLGTGKVTPEEMAGIQHHLLDIIEPTEIYTGADFKRDATAALEEILKRGSCPIIAGGTFFYLDLLRNKLSAAPVEPDETLREKLSTLSNATLLEMIFQKDPARATTIDRDNRRRLIRALEIIEAVGTVPPTTTETSPYDWLIIGINIEKETLHKNIVTRLQARLDAGLIKEVSNLYAAGVSYQRLESLGLEYRYIARYLQGIYTKDEMEKLLETKIKQFAKRQLTWLKRDATIEWFTPLEQEAIFARVQQFLQK